MVCFRREGMVGVGLEKSFKLAEGLEGNRLVAVGGLDFREAAHGELELSLRGHGMDGVELEELSVLKTSLFVLAILVKGVGKVDEGLEAKFIVGCGLENPLELFFGLRETLLCQFLSAK